MVAMTDLSLNTLKQNPQFYVEDIAMQNSVAARKAQNHSQERVHKNIVLLFMAWLKYVFTGLRGGSRPIDS